MTLYTYYKKDNKAVYATSVNGKSFFFFSGFNTAEEAKKAVLENREGFEKFWLETALVGEWSEIK